MLSVFYLENNTLQRGGVELIESWKANGGNVWIDMHGVETKEETSLLTALGCHPLAIQDAQRTRRPPKIEQFEQFTFILYRGFSSSKPQLDIETMALAGFLGENILITRRVSHSYAIQALSNSAQLANYLRSPSLLFTKIMNTSAQKFTDAILDAEDEISELEDEMLANSSDDLMNRLILLKSHLRKIQRVQSYHAKLTKQMMDESFLFIDTTQDEIKHSLRDVHDKFERLESLTAMYYDLCGDLIEGYISLSSHRLNRTMQILTVVSAIFVPLTFVAGIYGMNFEYIPELSFKYGYFVLWGAMVAMASGLLFVFKRIRWL
jgi:magnesium transporter